MLNNQDQDSLDVNYPLMYRVCEFIAPWLRHQYRGKRKRICQVLGADLAPTTIRDWKIGKRNPSLEFIERMLAFMRTEAARTEKLAVELETALTEAKARKALHIERWRRGSAAKPRWPKNKPEI